MARFFKLIHVNAADGTYQIISSPKDEERREQDALPLMLIGSKFCCGPKSELNDDEWKWTLGDDGLGQLDGAIRHDCLDSNFGTPCRWRRLDDPRHSSGDLVGRRSSALDVLEERCARGEIKRDEYLKKSAISPLETRLGGDGAHWENAGSPFVLSSAARCCKAIAEEPVCWCR